MVGPLVRSKTAAVMAQLVASRAGRRLLETHGWRPATPIVVARYDEPLNDVMVLVGVHDYPLLLAMLEPRTQNLCLVHVTFCCPDLQVVPVVPDCYTAGQLHQEAVATSLLTFRAKYWEHSAVAHAYPEVTELPEWTAVDEQGVPYWGETS